jgi:hypothetical protein
VTRGPVLLLACFVTADPDIEMTRVEDRAVAKWCVEIVPCDRAELRIRIATTNSSRETFVVGGCRP